MLDCICGKVSPRNQTWIVDFKSQIAYHQHNKVSTRLSQHGVATKTATCIYSHWNPIPLMNTHITALCSGLVAFMNWFCESINYDSWKFSIHLSQICIKCVVHVDLEPRLFIGRVPCLFQSSLVLTCTRLQAPQSFQCIIIIIYNIEWGLGMKLYFRLSACNMREGLAVEEAKFWS